MKMKELKMYEAPKMEVVEVELETIFAASTNADNAGMKPGEGEDGEW